MKLQKRIIVLYGLLTLMPWLCFGQDPELTNYRSGISLVWQGEKGTDYVEEYLYHDKVISDRKIVYLKAGTKISMAHNGRNIAGPPNGEDTYHGVGLDIGVIKFKPDGDQHWELYPKEWETYSSPVSFSEMDYGIYGDAETPVVGSVGSVGGPLTLKTKETHYHRGVTDAIGDEWHTLTVADDDSDYSGSSEFKSSDGKIFHFIVNPKAPAITWRVSGNGQFYTTPPRKYFIPRVYDQTTYFTSGNGAGVTVEIRDINGNEVFYRIGSGEFIAAGASHVTLSESAFTVGENVLQYYYAGNEAFVKTRKVVKNPDYPSAGEAHGDRLWGDAVQFETEVKPRVASISLSTAWLDNWRKSSTWNRQPDIEGFARKGHRHRRQWMSAPNALVARWDGMNAKKNGAPRSYIDYAKLGLFEIRSILDPVGLELNHSNNPIPTRELYYRGYYDVNGFFDTLISYDIIAGYYRKDQGYENGLTPIEDYFIRDQFAATVHNNHLSQAGYFSPGRDTFGFGGMWETSMRVGGMMAMIMMPSYATEYYGTSGLDGNTVAPLDAPFPGLAATWKKIFFDNDTPTAGFPNVHKRFGIEENLIVEDGNWFDKSGYTSTINCGHVLGIYGNLIKLYGPEVDTTRFDRFLDRAANQTLVGLKDNRPAKRSLAALQNIFYPTFRNVVKPRMLSLANNNSESLNRNLLQGGPLYVIWYDHNLQPPTSGVVRTIAPEFSVGGGVFSSAQTVTISSATPDSTIYYTLDGSSPTTSSPAYTEPLVISSNTTLRAYATVPGLLDSTERMAEFIIGISPPSAPVIGPMEDIFLVETPTITMSSETPDTSIFYTMDGSVPSSSSMRYEQPFPYAQNGEIRAVAVKGEDPGVSSPFVSKTIQYNSYLTTPGEFIPAVFPEQNARFTFSITATPDEPVLNQLVGLTDAYPFEEMAAGNPSSFSFGDYAAIVRFAPSGLIDARNGNAYNAVNQLRYAAGVSYEIIFVVDFASKTYDASINGVIIAKDFAFRKAGVNSLKYLVIWSSENSVASLQVTSPEISLTPRAPRGLRKLPEPE